MKTSKSTAPDPTEAVTGRGYRITVDEGRDSFFALCLEEQENEDAWLMSDTVCALEPMQ